jgi:hypothetical protein
MTHSVLRAAIMGTVTSALVLTVSSETAQSAGRPRSETKPSAECQRLASDYENASRMLALNAALNGADDSAARVNMRNSEDVATIQKAQLTLELMRGHSCKLPTFAPSASRYGNASALCQGALQIANMNADIQAKLGNYSGFATPPECDTSNWKPDRN